MTPEAQIEAARVALAEYEMHGIDPDDRFIVAAHLRAALQAYDAKRAENRAAFVAGAEAMRAKAVALAASVAGFGSASPAVIACEVSKIDPLQLPGVPE